MAVTLAILTVSDRCSAGKAVDLSGPALRNCLLTTEPMKYKIIEEACVPDDVDVIEKKLRDWCCWDSKIDIVLTTGGTGFAPRDVTPEATGRVVDKYCPAIPTAMTVASLQITPLAMLSRSVSGIKNSTLIINLPGSPKGAVECLKSVIPCFKHAREIISGDNFQYDATHRNLSSSSDELPKSKIDNRKVIERERISSWPMVSMQDATTMVMDSVTRLEPITLPLREVLGYVTSCETKASDNLPPFAASVKDGYAVNTLSGTGEFKVVSALTAGCSPDGIPQLGVKECVRVNTGGPIPPGADAVVQVEDTTLVKSGDSGDELIIRFEIQPTKQQDIRQPGCDITIGETVLPAHTEVRSAEHGILAAVGSNLVSVFRKPVVAVLSTGNELVPAGQNLVPGMIRDSNMTTLCSLLSENGFKAVNMGIAKDEPNLLLKELKRSFSTADVVITTGSVSMGEKDFLKAVLQADLNADIKFGRVNMKPGKPTTFAIVPWNDESKYVFALPGNPVSATVMTHLLVIPALRKMSGHPSPFPTTLPATLDFEVTLDERPEYRRAILEFDRTTGMFIAKSTGNQMSSRLLSWREANSLLILPSKKDAGNKLPKGCKVDALIVEKI